MVDFNFVTTRLAVGGHIYDSSDGIELHVENPKPKNYPKSMERLKHLYDIGFNHIINTQIEFDDNILLKDFPYKIEYLHLPVFDDHKEKSVEWYGSAIDFALTALSKPNNKVYVHCAAGRARSTTAVYAILRAQGFDSSMAEDRILRCRPEATLHFYREFAERAIGQLGYN